MIKHIVLFKLKDSSPESIGITAGVLRGLQGKVEQLKELEVGIDVVKSARSYDIALVATFDSLDDLEGYQVHPEHKKVIEHMSQVRESQVAVDFEF
ncbi:stress responsive alpha/beta barrel protein [Fontibacillus phaseoli]|uniref:Stress responsive alpha/beta barrel protein n=1 Tax=Fontibacillus phaseoli TaxID=1416533 RepID=A0A369BJJ5_9BACL|nr:Dabb family protein [Fontibacillus phaseoli]RCX21770.1 stress responsive alpha/beta barrel protein [Fontibacillus phaseoli]